MDMCGIEDLMANNLLVQAKNNSAACEKYRKLFTLPGVWKLDLKLAANEAAEERLVDSSVFPEIKKKVKQELDATTTEDCAKDEKKLSRFHFTQLCEKQPIGKKMFTAFCQSAEKKIKDPFSLAQAIRDYEISIASEQLDIAKEISKTYFVPNSACEVPCLPEELKSACTTIITLEPAPNFEKTKEIIQSSKVTNPDSKETAINVIGQCCNPDEILINLPDDERRFQVIKSFFDYCKSQITNFFVDEAFSEYKKSKEYETFLRWKYKEKEPVIEDDFQSLRILGRGGFGEVYAYQVKCTGKLYACKKTCKKRMKKKHAEKLVHVEKLTLESINSPFVVNLAYAYDNKTYLNLVMTLMGSGDLKYHIYETADKKRGLSPERTKFYTAQITLGMDHLHNVDILYRDLKPENVLLDDQGNVRIADLGLVCILTGNQKTSGRAGTIGFMAPEMLQNEEYSFGVDWFALGCTIYEMMEGRGSFLVKDKNRRKVDIDGTVKKTISESHTYKRSHPSSLIDLVDRLLEKKVSDRLAGDERSAEAIKRHPYFSDLNWDRLEAGLTPVPFVPDPNQVYAKDVSEIRMGSEVKGVELTSQDKDFYKKFSTGRIPITWQQEVIDTGLFDDIMEGKYEKQKGKKKEKSKICTLL